MLDYSLPILSEILSTESAFFSGGAQHGWNLPTPQSYLILRNNMNAFLMTLTGLGFSNNLAILIDPIIELFIESVSKTFKDTQLAVAD